MKLSKTKRTKTKLCFLLMAGLMGGAAWFGPAASASAVAPDAAPRSAVLPATNLLGGVVLSANSVVATARVPYNGIPSTVTVAWGDGVTSPGVLGVPSGSVLVMYHTYAAPANGLPFVATLTVSSNGDSVARGLLITPRYSVTKSTELFSPLALCDSVFETQTEWRVKQEVHQGAYNGPVMSTKQWEFDLNTGNVAPPAPTMYPLDGSNLYFEMTMADPTLVVAHEVRELDPIIDDYLNVDLLVDLHPSLGVGTHDGGSSNGEFSGDCDAKFDSTVTVALLTPPPPPEPVNVPHIPPTNPPPSPPNPPRCQGNPRNCQEP